MHWALLMAKTEYYLYHFNAPTLQRKIRCILLQLDKRTVCLVVSLDVCLSANFNIG